MLNSEVATEVATSEAAQTAVEHAPEAMDAAANDPVTAVASTGALLSFAAVSSFAANRTIGNVPNAARNSYNRVADMKTRATETITDTLGRGSDEKQRTDDSDVADDSGDGLIFTDNDDDDGDDSKP
ncbi:hypothetical protein [Halococcoides cellulosivorans]|uniref:hypothetical protein n=1 Tax=Halococcoides cellulosivorans TaxID=1679096 RepID=UPI00131F0AEC|nr:hypothetical protein [Halococcoides cellulosivorans]